MELERRKWFNSHDASIQEEIAATQAQQNIELLRGQAATDDLLERANHTSLEYYQATEFALRRIFNSDGVNQPASPLQLSKNQCVLRSPTDASNMAGLLTQLKGDIHHPQSEDHNSQKQVWTLVSNYFEEVSLFRKGQRARPEPLRY